MKLCWEVLDDIYLTKYGNLRHKTRGILYEKEECVVCKQSFLGKKKEKCCCRTCSYVVTAKYHKGKNRSKDTRRRISEMAKKRDPSTRRGPVRNGKNNTNWKGGYSSKNIPLYDTYAYQLDQYEEIRRSPEDENVLELKCAYCGKWFVPSTSEVSYRISALKGQRVGYSEHRLYCSDNCKRECPIYNKQKYPRGFKLATSREVQPELRQMVLKRDEYTCQKCNTTDKSLHCHHISGVTLNPIESADIDNCITLCKECHKEVHRQKGCGYNDMKCKESNK